MLAILLLRALPLVVYPQTPVMLTPTFEGPNPAIARMLDTTITVRHSLGQGTVKGRTPWATESLAPSDMSSVVVAKGRL